MKRIGTRKVLFAFVWLTAVVQVFAGRSFSSDGFKYTIMKDGVSLSLTGYQPVTGVDYSQTLHIPAHITYNGKAYSVKRIAPKAFKGVTEVRSVVVDEGIENIGSHAFECCVNLKSIHLPTSVESIGGGLFGSCYNLVSVVVAAGNECYDSRDNSNAIIDTDNDELLVACSSTRIPASVRSIGDFAFYHCNVMEKLVIPNGVETIGNNAFFGCSSLKTVSLPETLAEIGGDAFCGCNSLTSILIPKNVVRIGNGNVFAGCGSLASVVVDDANPNYDSRSDCNGIVRKADSALVATCRATTIGNDISVLGSYCYYGTAIHSVNIPKSVTEIHESAFDGCGVIDEMTVAADNPAYMSPEGSNAILSRDGRTLFFGCRTTVIPHGVETIGNNAFMGRYSRLMLRVPETVKTIGLFAFSGCDDLSEVIIPQSVRSVGAYAFSGCSNLSAVQILAPLKRIDDNTFSRCYNLSAVSLPDGIEVIDSYAFSSCRNLEHISIPSSVIKVEGTAFENCPVAKRVGSF